MTCCKVPIKIAGFSGGCARVTNTLGTLTNLTSINDTDFQVSSISISYLAYLGLKCVNLACPPNIEVGDTLGDLAAFLDAQLASTINTDVTLGALGTAGATAYHLTRNGIARLIAGCGCCTT